MRIHHKEHKSHKTIFLVSHEARKPWSFRNVLPFLCLLWPFPVKIRLPNFATAPDINILLIIPFVDNSS